jgi:hypothetical protein
VHKEFERLRARLIFRRQISITTLTRLSAPGLKLRAEKISGCKTPSERTRHTRRDKKWRKSGVQISGASDLIRRRRRSCSLSYRTYYILSGEYISQEQRADEEQSHRERRR